MFWTNDASLLGRFNFCCREEALSVFRCQGNRSLTFAHRAMVRYLSSLDFHRGRWFSSLASTSNHCQDFIPSLAIEIIHSFLPYFLLHCEFLNQGLTGLMVKVALVLGIETAICLLIHFHFHFKCLCLHVKECPNVRSPEPRLQGRKRLNPGE